MKRLLLYAALACPIITMIARHGTAGIVYGIAESVLFLVLLGIVNAWWNRIPVCESVVMGFDFIIFRPWRYRWCDNCRRFHPKCCWGVK